MKDRIKIDGVWYVREDISEKKSKPKKEIHLTEFCGLVYENEDYSWEATRLYKDDKTFYEGINIKFTDKRKEQPWIEDHWDNNEWFKGLLKRKTDSLNFANEVMDEEGVEEFIELLKVLEKKNWL